MNDHETENEPRRKRPVLSWILGLALGFVLGGALLAVLSSGCDRDPGSREWRGRSRCAANLKGIYYAAMLYEEAHHRPPPSLGAMVEDGLIDARTLVCPSARTIAALSTQPADLEAHCPYVYVPLPNSTLEPLDHLVIAFEMPFNHLQRGTNVAGQAGWVRWIDRLTGRPGARNSLMDELQDLNDYLDTHRRKGR